MKLRTSLLAILINSLNCTIIRAKESIQKSEVKFGPKIEWYSFLGFGYAGVSFGQTYTLGPFIEYASIQRNRAFANPGIEIGLLYGSSHINIKKREIDPILRLKPISIFSHLKGTVELNIKSLVMPIIGKLYLGKRNKFCYSIGFYVAYILTAKKIDPHGEFMKTLSYELLDQKDKEYDTETNKKAYYIFYNGWKKRKDKYTALSVKNSFLTPWVFGFNTGIQYEFNIGLILGLSILSEKIGHMLTTGLIVTSGYNLNKIFKIGIE